MYFFICFKSKKKPQTELVFLSAFYCCIVVFAAISWPNQANYIRNSHFIFKVFLINFIMKSYPTYMHFLH